MQLSWRRGCSRSIRGFSLIEVALVVAIVALLVGGAMATLSSQVEQRNQDETRRRLDAALEALIGYAIVNRRLPCPARFADLANHSAGRESFCPAAAGTCVGTETTVVQAHGNCSNYVDGFVPAVAMAMQPTDTQGFAVDAWGNRLRYAVSGALPPAAPPNPPFGCTGTSASPHFTSAANLKANGVSCRPNDLVVCASSIGTTTSSCNTAASVTNQNTVALIVFSTGKNGAIASAYGADEAANLNGDAVFVSRPPSGSDAANGVYDDIMLWVPVGVLYSRLISAGVLP